MRVLIAALLLCAACGGSTKLPAAANYKVQVLRDPVDDSTAFYRCAGDINIDLNKADFICDAALFAHSWFIQGQVEFYGLENGRLRFWIYEGAHIGQPALAIDADPDGDHFTGWATLRFPNSS